MDTPLIEMPVEDAKMKLDAYRSQLRRRADEEYEAAERGYAALAAGRPLINLTDAFEHAGLGEDHRPKLAIARADRKQVCFRRYPNLLRFDARKNPNHYNQYITTLIIDVPYTTRTGYGSDGYALVPMVPADVRPNVAMNGCFVLWEVEKWSDSPISAPAPFDPYLLQHIVGDLYAVLAEWDLTELERAIMSGRRNA